MSDENCWFCSQPHLVKENDIGKCANCLVDIDRTLYEPLTEPYKKEEDVGDLGNWAKKNSKFLKLADGESYEGVYKGYKEGTNMNGDPTIIYKIDDKELKSSSAKLAVSFDVIPLETKIKLSRAGEGLKTIWTVEKI